MPDTFYHFVVAPVIVWMALLSLFVIGCLIRLEIAERRKNRRMEIKRAQLNLTAPYRPKTARPLALKPRVLGLANASLCPNPGQVFPNVDRHTGWNVSAGNLN
jgi:hypothetical protein